MKNFYPQLAKLEKTALHGPYIIARNSPSIFISEAGDLYLQTAGATLVLTAAGEIKLSGKIISQHAEEDLSLFANRHIYLNSE